ncbi:DMT family transporter [Micromonospora yasonensis]|uniref:DMT family transporter n=1 Tax=Micromonospora yasonensis TaxID=1128667 RepID=UPI0022307B48|nr:DMT family transporter [Micromonospora yasonensis]MCW3840349.1 DMT family transporter [Micromonospora yasonensis]
MVSSAGQLAFGVPLALGAAAAFGASSVLQFRASWQVPQERAGRPRLLVHLLGVPSWRWSVVLAILAFACQVAALSRIPLILVQPLLVSGLIWYVLLFAASRHVRPDRPLLVESALCLLGLSAFLLIARPAPGQGGGFGSLWSAALLLAAVAVTVGLCLLAALRLDRRWRPLPLALAAGVCYGVTAGLISSLTHLHEAPLAVFGQWQTYALIVLGPFGVLLSQNAYQAGPVGAPALATITVTDPLVAIAVGLLWLNERIETGLGSLLGEVLALAVVAGAVYLLARRAPHASARYGGKGLPDAASRQ